jgi:DNA 3'-phosphatase
MSNQAGISLKSDPKSLKSDQKRLADFKTKVSAVLNQLDLPIAVYAATERDQYRKPRVGMWQEMLEDYDLESADAVDLANSFFVGDAGGREAVPGGAPKDHSCVDRCGGPDLPFQCDDSAKNVQRLCCQCWHTVSHSRRVLLARRGETIRTKL